MIVRGVRANRAFLRRAVQYLAGEAGIRQFLDIGSGLPTNENTHQVAQQLAADSRVVYVDSGPIVQHHHGHHLRPGHRGRGPAEPAGGPVPLRPRSRAEIARYFAGLDLIEPGLVHLPEWRAQPDPSLIIAYLAGVGRKP
jgi:S-adenosyl methyltransferase